MEKGAGFFQLRKMKRVGVIDSELEDARPQKKIG